MMLVPPWLVVPLAPLEASLVTLPQYSAVGVAGSSQLTDGPLQEVSKEAVIQTIESWKALVLSCMRQKVSRTKSIICDGSLMF
jgi:hypothetical protein